MYLVSSNLMSARQHVIHGCISKSALYVVSRLHQERTEVLMFEPEGCTTAKKSCDEETSVGQLFALHSQARNQRTLFRERGSDG